MKRAVLLVILLLALSMGQTFSDVLYKPIDFSSSCNWRMQLLDPQFPEGDQVFNGIPIAIPRGGLNSWAAYATLAPGIMSVDIDTNVYGALEVYSQINSAWGQPGPTSYAWLEFFGSDGAYYKKDLIGNVDIRDYNQNNFTNDINGTTTVNVLNVGQHRLDMQKIALPEQFASQRLIKIRLTDNGAENFQRVFLSGLTAAYDPTTDTIPPVVTITSPTTSPTYSTSAYTIDISGTASDNAEVTSVSWSNNRGGNGTCEGTTSWAANRIRLLSGSNVITVTAHDAMDNYASAMLTVTCSATGKVLYVKTTGDDTSSGLSWSLAKKTVQAAINAASAGDQVWVAAGTYINTSGSINLKNGVALYGGFPAGGGTWSTRNISANTTMLDGNQNGSVICAWSGVTETALVDGFTIRNGKAVDGGGINCNSASPSVSNNIITGCTATRNGGGINCALASSAIISHNLISGNTAIYTGGIFIYYSTPSIIANNISNNSASYNAAINCDNSTPLILGNTITGNNSTVYAAAICFYRSNARLIGNTISGNTQGGVYCYEAVAPVIADNVISGNDHNGIGCQNSSPTIERNSISGNSSCGVWCDGQSSPNILSNVVYTNGLSGIICGSGSPVIVNNTITGHVEHGINNYNGSTPTLANNLIAYNTYGIAAYPNGSGQWASPTLSHNCVYGNTSNYFQLQAGATDITQDPLFIDRDAGNYRLAMGSPCFNAGDDSAVQSGWLDMDSKPRIQGTYVDMGAYEYATVQPVIQITSPTTEPSTNTSHSFINISGVASSRTRLSTVTWSTNTGASGSGSGTTTWKADYIPLQRGENTVTVTTRDMEGNIASDTLLVVYEPILNPSNGHYYELVSDSDCNWWTAKSRAEGRHWNNLYGHLATVTSAEENAWITENVLLPCGMPTPWIGGYQAHSSADYSEPNGGWRWVTNEPWTYSNWDSLNPSNDLGVEDYVHFSWATPNTQSCFWNDYPDSGVTGGYVVEYEPDVTAPSIFITDPVSTPTYVVNQPSVTLKGTASDNADIASVQWSSDRGPSGACTGITSWVAADIPLFVGDNNITIIVRDSAGNTSSDKLLVVRDASLQVIYANDFETSNVQMWSNRITDVTPAGNRRFLGQFNNNTTTLLLNQMLPLHTSLTVTFDLYVIRTWDGNNKSLGPDRWLMRIDGKLVADTTFSNYFPNWGSYTQSYPASTGTAYYPWQTGASEVNTLGYSWSDTVYNGPIDSVYRMSYTVPHTAPSVNMTFYAQGLQQLLDESWGIDNVVVSTSLADYSSIGEVKKLPLGSAIRLKDAVVTAMDAATRTAFVEAADKSSGIKLLPPMPLTIGNKVELMGTLDRVDGEYFIRNINLTNTTDGTPLTPMAITTRTIGNDLKENLNYKGINTTGLLVRAAGKVSGTITASNCFYLDDGLSYEDGIGPVRGIRVAVPSADLIPSESRIVSVTGISRVRKDVLTDWRKVNGDWYPKDTTLYVPYIWVRNANDITIIR